MVVEARDCISYMPDECLSVIFQSLSRRWLMIEGQSCHRLSLNAQADLLPLVPMLFTRFDSVTKLALKW
ncbi:unnamed protein product [Linum trigynum]|uniref:Uncharacterized protein n=1 Tax=Linum trigynum TaxID=586398 RepID=A0AAV2EVN9_9ROSI